MTEKEKNDYQLTSQFASGKSFAGAKQKDDKGQNVDALTIEQAFAYKQILSFCSKAQKNLKELQDTLGQVKKINEEQLKRGGGSFSSKDVLAKINASEEVGRRIDDAQKELDGIITDLRKIPSLQKVTGLALSLGGKTDEMEDESGGEEG